MAYIKHGYPKLVVDLGKLRHNIEYVKDLCAKEGVEIAGVIKGCTGLVPCAREYEKAGVKYYVVEQDICPGDSFDSVKQSADYIKARYM